MTTRATRQPAPATAQGTIRVGIGGWDYDPWRETFYPPDVKKKDALAYASAQVTAIEINGTYYRTQKPESFAKWHDATPDDFVFAVKASRYTTNRKVLAEAGDSIDRFVGSGLAELGPKLGPLLWQFMPTKRFDEQDFSAFLELLPETLDDVPLRHALDVRHDSFRCAEFVALARRHGAAIVYSDSDDYPMIDEVTADFVYLRLMRAKADVATGYPDDGIARWTSHALARSHGRTPPVPSRDGDPVAESIGGAAAGDTPQLPMDAFVFFINGAKERAPAGARAMLERLRGPR